MRRILPILALGLLQIGIEPARASADRVQTLLDAQDSLALRTELRKLAQARLKSDDWLRIRELLLKRVAVAGFDALYAWDRTAPVNELHAYSVEIRRLLNSADALMQKRAFSQAFDVYQKVARALKKEAALPKRYGHQAKLLTPYVLHSMGRALYGAGRYHESLEVLEWIPPSYPKFRQALFERMWAAFRAGQVDRALGAVASQRSAYFSSFLHPEAYLVQLYLYKRLCREDDARKVIEEMKAFQRALNSGDFSLEAWMKLDVERSVLWSIVSQKAINDSLKNEREAERNRILKASQKAYEHERAQWKESLTSALSYAQLSLGGTAKALPPVDKLPSRQALFAQGLEIWPADKAEDWIDELGSHRFNGDSQCASLR